MLAFSGQAAAQILLTPAAGALLKMLAEPAREGAVLGKAGLGGRFAHRQLRILQRTQRGLAAHGVQRFLKAGVLGFQVPLQRAGRIAKRAGHMGDAVAPVGKQRLQGAAHLLLQRPGHGPRRMALHQAAGVALHQAVVIGIDGLQILVAHHDAIEVRAEHDLAAQHAAMVHGAARRAVREVDAGRAPVLAQLIAAQAHQRRDTQLHRVTPRTLALGIQVQLDDGIAPLGHHLRAHGGADHVVIVLEGLEQACEAGLVLQQQADRPEVGQTPMRSHEQAQRSMPGLRGGSLQQLRKRRFGNHEVGRAQTAVIQPHLAEHAQRIDAELIGHLGVFAQAHTSDTGLHRDQENG